LMNQNECDLLPKKITKTCRKEKITKRTNIVKIAPCRGLGAAVKRHIQGRCCGFGFAMLWLSWIRIRIGSADPDSESRKTTKLTNKPDIQLLKKLLYLRGYVL
jgi:hypothetical protein